MDNLRYSAFAGFAVKWRARSPRRPDSLALPAGLRIVDPPVHSFSEKPQGIRYAHHHPLAVHQRDQRIGGVAGQDGRVLAEPEGIELVHPVVVMGVGTAGIFHVLEVRSGRRIKSPAFLAVLPERGWAVERTFALTAIETGEVSAAERDPGYVVAVDIHAARRVSARGDFIVFGQCGFRRIRARDDAHDSAGEAEDG